MAAPLFPLSSSQTPGGPDGGDIGNQPGDISFVLDQVLSASTAPNGPLSGLVDRNEIGAAGHSNGAITTLGLVANSCCRDTRVKAAVVMAGTTEGLGRGSYNLAKAPPLLVVSDIHDGLVPYGDAVAVFNQARGPKALLALDWDSSSDSTGSTAHMAPLESSVRRQARSSSQRRPSSMPSSSTSAGRDRPSGRWSLLPVGRARRLDAGLTATLPAPSRRRSTYTPLSLRTQACTTARPSPFDGVATPRGRWSISSSVHTWTSLRPARPAAVSPRGDPHPDPTGSGSVVLHVGTGAIGKVATRRTAATSSSTTPARPTRPTPGRSPSASSLKSLRRSRWRTTPGSKFLAASV